MRNDGWRTAPGRAYGTATQRVEVGDGDRPGSAAFMDEDCSGTAPVALYGYGRGGDGAPQSDTQGICAGIAVAARLYFFLDGGKINDSRNRTSHIVGE